MNGLLDTNVALYVLEGRLSPPLPEDHYGVSVITEMELRAWPSLTPQEEIKVKAFLQTVVLCELTPEIRQRTVQLRRDERLKLPDAIIGATALVHGVNLWTNDQRLLNVPGLNCRQVVIHPATHP